TCPAGSVARRAPRYAREASAATYDVALRLADQRTGATLAYIPTAGAVDDAVRSVARGADLLLFDGTFWSDGELRAAGVDAVTAREMGHLPVSGAGGSVGALPRLGAKRTVLVHINNTNPILCRDSAERAQVEAAGVEVGDDGRADGEGGLEAWLRLAEAMGVERDTLLAGRWVLPGVRFAVEAYITFCRTRPWIEAVAASLTELFAPTIVSQRLSAILAHYKWIDPAGLEYFRTRLQQAPRDAEHALALVTERCRTRELQERAVAALDFKCDVLWSLLDAVERGPLPGNAR